MQKNTNAKHRQAVLLAENAMLAALIVVMAFTPLGYLRAGPLELTLLMVPVIVGAVTCSPASGAILGAVFGLTSFIQCFTGSPLGTVLAAISIPRTLLVCLLPRVLAGYLCGLFFRMCKHRDKKGGWSFAVAACSGALLNTVLFLGALALLFWNVQFTDTQAAALGGAGTALQTVIAIAAGINAPIEAVVTTILGAAVGKGVATAIKKI